MKNDLTYVELNKQLSDPNNPLFGGSLAYIEIELSLRMMIKLLRIKKKKPSIQTKSYEKMILICNVIAEQANEMITKDGEIFASLRSAKAGEERNKIIDDVFPKSTAFLENLNTINMFLEEMIVTTTSSIRYDYIMISSTLNSCYKNLIHILEYEVNKHSDDNTKQSYLDKIEKLAKR
ncbi:MAG: hypothetical protein WCR63_01790 [Bacilli bacterium]